MTLAVAPRLFVVDGDVLTDGHALASLELAMARAYCGRLSAYSSTIRIPYDVRDAIDLRTTALTTLINRRGGGLEAYCAGATVPFVNNENSLMVYETMLLRLAPDLSVAQVGQALHLSRIGFVVAFIYALTALGGSVAAGFAILLCALFEFSRMHDQIYSNYPFFFPLILLEAAVLGLFARRAEPRPIWQLGVMAVILGALAAFVTNMRTSFLPLQLVLLVCLLAADRAVFSPRHWRQKAARAALASVVFAAGYQAFQYGMITRGLPADGRHGAGHTIGHPLVLSLGVPESDFSRRQGITWLDEVGRQKALSVDPQAIYLGPRYDAALITYYRSLWSSHANEMFRLYWNKFSMAGTDMVATLRHLPGRDGRLLRWLLTPLSVVPNGIWLLAIYGLAAMIASWLYVRRQHAVSLVAAFLSAGAFLCQAEAGLIYSLFVDQYHNYLVIYAMILSIALLQVVANSVDRVLTRTAARA